MRPLRGSRQGAGCGRRLGRRRRGGGSGKSGAGLEAPSGIFRVRHSRVEAEARTGRYPARCRRGGETRGGVFAASRSRGRLRRGNRRRRRREPQRPRRRRPERLRGDARARVGGVAARVRSRQRRAGHPTRRRRRSPRPAVAPRGTPARPEDGGFASSRGSREVPVRGASTRKKRRRRRRSGSSRARGGARRRRRRAGSVRRDGARDARRRRRRRRQRGRRRPQIRRARGSVLLRMDARGRRGTGWRRRGRRGRGRVPRERSRDDPRADRGRVLEAGVGGGGGCSNANPRQTRGRGRRRRRHGDRYVRRTDRRAHASRPARVRPELLRASQVRRRVRGVRQRWGSETPRAARLSGLEPEVRQVSSRARVASPAAGAALDRVADDAAGDCIRASRPRLARCDGRIHPSNEGGDARAAAHSRRTRDCGEGLILWRRRRAPRSRRFRGAPAPPLARESRRRRRSPRGVAPVPRARDVEVVARLGLGRRPRRNPSRAPAQVSFETVRDGRFLRERFRSRVDARGGVLERRARARPRRARHLNLPRHRPRRDPRGHGRRGVETGEGASAQAGGSSAPPDTRGRFARDARRPGVVRPGFAHRAGARGARHRRARAREARARSRPRRPRLLDVPAEFGRKFRRAEPKCRNRRGSPRRSLPRGVRRRSRAAEGAHGTRRGSARRRGHRGGRARERARGIDRRPRLCVGRIVRDVG